MHHLGATDLRAVLDFLWRMRTITSRGAFVAAALEGLKSLISCDVVSYNEFDAASRGFHTDALPTSALGPEIAAPFTRHYRDHPLVVHQLQTGDGTPHRITDMGSMRAFRGTALFSEVYRPARLHWEMAMTLPAAAGVIRCVALDRDGRDFSERDLAILHVARPYLNELQRELDAAGNVPSLNRRERDVLALVARGQTNREIAAALAISPRTVQKHLEHVYDKLGIRRRAGAAVLAHARRLEDTTSGS